jgi:hypothetical protein
MKKLDCQLMSATSGSDTCNCYIIGALGPASMIASAGNPAGFIAWVLAGSSCGCF